MPLLKSNSRKFLFIFFLLILTVVLAGCSAIGFGKPAALQVTSKPEAALFLDDKHIGKTPFFSDQLEPGDHTLKITVSEASFVEKISLTSGTLTVVDRDLSPNFLAQAGEMLTLVTGQQGLSVTSMPSEATVTLDGQLIGKTPLLVKDIAEGDHKVLVAKDGYVNREFAIKTTSKYQLSAQVTLASQEAKDTASGNTASPQPQASKIQITQTPQGFLRVRQSASIDSTEIGRVNTGDQLEVVQETPDWIEVKFGGKQGWISAQYTQKLP